MKELGEAINGSLSESEQIAQVIAKIKEQGYDIFLVLEATIGFNRKNEEPLYGKYPGSTVRGWRVRATLSPFPRSRQTGGHFRRHLPHYRYHPLQLHQFQPARDLYPHAVQGALLEPAHP